VKKLVERSPVAAAPRQQRFVGRSLDRIVRHVT
jgi:hypothetical protein